jgi:hypothetical protein
VVLHPPRAQQLPFGKRPTVETKHILLIADMSCSK